MTDFARENIVFIVSLILIAGIAAAAPQLRNMLAADDGTAATSAPVEPINIPASESQTTTATAPIIVTPSTSSAPITKSAIPKPIIRRADEEEVFDN